MAGFAKKVGGCGWFLIVSGGFGGFRLVPPFSMYHYLHVANVLNKTTIRLCNYQESLKTFLMTQNLFTLFPRVT